jgi:hypothetical protein
LYDSLITLSLISNHSFRLRLQVAQIIPLPANDSAVVDLNAGIPAWAASKNSSVSPIWVVDQYTGFSSSDLRNDSIHPNDSGDHKMEAKWYPAMLQAIASLG